MHIPGPRPITMQFWGGCGGSRCASPNPRDTKDGKDDSKIPSILPAFSQQPLPTLFKLFLITSENVRSRVTLPPPPLPCLPVSSNCQLCINYHALISGSVPPLFTRHDVNPVLGLYQWLFFFLGLQQAPCPPFVTDHCYRQIGHSMKCLSHKNPACSLAPVWECVSYELAIFI